MGLLKKAAKALLPDTYTVENGEVRKNGKFLGFKR
jgi:hypothetical protein